MSPPSPPLSSNANFLLSILHSKSIPPSLSNFPKKVIASAGRFVFHTPHGT